MLKNAPIATTLPVVDMERARGFYEEKLGLKPLPLQELPGHMLYECGEGTKLGLYQREHTKADHTVASFMVKDVEAEVKELKQKGVPFEEYDTPTIKTVESIATLGQHKVAWFEDTEGNLLAITQF
jgi:catechol 2,3-dioxygenase-like lactoylglutathione lyase family enzyme